MPDGLPGAPGAACRRGRLELRGPLTFIQKLIVWAAWSSSAKIMRCAMDERHGVGFSIQLRRGRGR